MSTNLQAASPLFFERYELKYQIPKSLVDPISNYISAYCELDYYSQISPDGFYTINSLYLDSPQLTFFNNKESTLAKRFNMRIRSYGDHPTKPYFFEIKEKSQDFVKKRRAKVNTSNLQSIVDGTFESHDVDLNSKKNLDRFLSFMHIYNAQPQVLTQYRRKAFFSTVEDYVRITFDAQLKFAEENQLNVWPDSKKLCHYDVADIYNAEKESLVVLELKCESRVPLWFLDMIRFFELERGSFSKYGNSIMRAKKFFL